MILALAITGLVLAAIPAILFGINLWLYRRAPSIDASQPTVLGTQYSVLNCPGPDLQSNLPQISVLIPARNEETSIAAAVESALASEGVEVEVLVLDDSSDDATGELVAQVTARDPRVRLLAGPPLPAGWCGKQHACRTLAAAASYRLLAFVDADVRLAPNGLARLAMFARKASADLVSGIPRQETGTGLERLVIPLIHFILLGFLPMVRMRATRSPCYAAGCGQLFLTHRDAYDRMGTHAVIRASLHDGISLPRAYRQAGLRTDLCDATDLAVCRMYHGASRLWFGLSKNATEGLGNPWLIGPATMLLLGGQVMPMLLWLAWPWLTPWTAAINGLATLLLFSPRLAGMRRFRQSWLGAALHPLGVAVLVAIQWYGFVRMTFGKPAMWKGRAYPERPLLSLR